MDIPRMKPMTVEDKNVPLKNRGGGWSQGDRTTLAGTGEGGSHKRTKSLSQKPALLYTTSPSNEHSRYCGPR